MTCSLPEPIDLVTKIAPSPDKIDNKMLKIGVKFLGVVICKLFINGILKVAFFLTLGVSESKIFKRYCLY